MRPREISRALFLVSIAVLNVATRRRALLDRSNRVAKVNGNKQVRGYVAALHGSQLQAAVSTCALLA
jgi:hypothetical protein